MLFLPFFFKKKLCKKPSALICSSPSIYKLAKSSFFFISSLLFLAHSFDMMLYYLFFLKKRISTRNHQHLFVVCWSLENRASLSIYRLAKSLFFYKLFAFLAPHDCSISFRLADIWLASHLYLFSIKYDLYIYIYLFFSGLFLTFI
jgi:hypothetical protein